MTEREHFGTRARAASRTDCPPAPCRYRSCAAPCRTRSRPAGPPLLKRRAGRHVDRAVLAERDARSARAAGFAGEQLFHLRELVAFQLAAHQRDDAFTTDRRLRIRRRRIARLVEREVNEACSARTGDGARHRANRRCDKTAAAVGMPAIGSASSTAGLPPAPQRYERCAARRRAPTPTHHPMAAARRRKDDSAPSPRRRPECGAARPCRKRIALWVRVTGAMPMLVCWACDEAAASASAVTTAPDQKICMGSLPRSGSCNRSYRTGSVALCSPCDVSAWKPPSAIVASLPRHRTSEAIP